MVKETLKLISASAFYKLVDLKSIETAYNFIIKHSISLIPSTKYSVLIHGMKFPPKDFLRVIAKLSGYEINESTFYGGEANLPFENLNFSIIKESYTGMENPKKDIFDLYRDYLMKYRANTLKQATIEAYTDSVKIAIPNRWEIINQEQIDVFNHTISYLLKYNAIFEKKDFQGVSSFESFIDNLIHKIKGQIPLNQILFGAPGTGKTYNTINLALSIIEQKSLEDYKKTGNRFEVRKKFNELVQEGRIVFTTFHQSMSYEDFIEGIKPQEPKDGQGQITYSVVDGIFKMIANKADGRKGNFYEVIEAFKKSVTEDDSKTPLTIKTPSTTFQVKYRSGNILYVSPLNTSKERPPWYPVNIDMIEQYFDHEYETGIYNITYVKAILNYLKQEKGLFKGKNENTDKPYVLIIDEINRGNVSSIFGELITLIEDDKRLGKKEAIEVTLPYSKHTFGVPSNLYIIGTMNTADRSVEALDAALRRRFSFVEMLPKPEILETEKEHTKVDLIKLLTVINERLELLIDKDHQIGHAYFIGISDIEELKNVFYNKIIPLLEEYFYGDFGKIGLVLGEAFIKEKNQSDILAKNFIYNGSADLSHFTEKKVYHITPKSSWDLNAFTSIYEQE